MYNVRVQVDQGTPLKPDILNLIKEKKRKSLKHIGTGEILLNRILVAQALRATIDKWDLIKSKSFF